VAKPVELSVPAVSFAQSDEAEMVNIYEKQLQMTADELKMEESFQKNYLKCIAKTPELLVSAAIASIKDFGTAVDELKQKQQELQDKKVHHDQLQTWESKQKLEKQQQREEAKKVVHKDADGLDIPQIEATLKEILQVATDTIESEAKGKLACFVVRDAFHSFFKERKLACFEKNLVTVFTSQIYNEFYLSSRFLCSTRNSSFPTIANQCANHSHPEIRAKTSHQVTTSTSAAKTTTTTETTAS
jgi:hypothetical protein